MDGLDTFKIANDTITLDDECRVVSCSKPDFIESALKEIKDCGDDLYYIDYVNSQYFYFYSYREGQLFAEVWSADKLSDQERSVLVVSNYEMDYKF